jgi:hypothetical protein
VVVLLLSIRPITNMLSPNQVINASFEPRHIVNTYGAFGSITRERDESSSKGRSKRGRARAARDPLRQATLSQSS